MVEGDQLASSGGTLVGNRDAAGWMARQIAWQRRLMELSKRAETALAAGRRPGGAECPADLPDRTGVTPGPRRGLVPHLVARIFGHARPQRHRRRVVTA